MEGGNTMVKNNAQSATELILFQIQLTPNLFNPHPRCM